MKVVLIVLNYNDYKTTEKYLNNINDFKSIDKIIVVDNCSTNESYNILKRYKNKKIDVISSDFNGGYAYGNNFGVKYVMKNYKPQFIIISNPDVSFNEEIVSKMATYLAHNEEVVLVAPQMMNEDNSKAIIAWKIPSFIDNIYTLFISLERFTRKRREYSSEYFSEDVSFVEVVPGSLFMVKTDFVKNYKLFDEGTFLYCEENILATKIKMENLKSAILNCCNYRHSHSTSIDLSFNSYNKKYKLLYKSLDYYNKEYINTGNVKNFVFKLFYNISQLEKIFITLVKKIIK